MKKLIMFFLSILVCLGIEAKKPVVDANTTETNSRIEVINDSTIIYYNVLGIQVAQPNEVYTGIFEYNPYAKKNKTMKLCTMNHGAYIWMNNGTPGTYILYASKAFDRVILRAKEN